MREKRSKLISYFFCLFIDRCRSNIASMFGLRLPSALQFAAQRMRLHRSRSTVDWISGKQIKDLYVHLAFVPFIGGL
jgi:hypothetical protein